MNKKCYLLSCHR
uniref:Uncharacterized protein n=1 Tax=Arundo donax TaxID=35708 RepID=A0A0A9ALY0_ARUDO